MKQKLKYIPALLGILILMGSSIYTVYQSELNTTKIIGFTVGGIIYINILRIYLRNFKSTKK